MRNLSITNRMLLVAFLPALMVAVLLGLYSVLYSLRNSEFAELERAATLAEGLASASEFGVTTNNTELLDDLAQPILAVPSIHSVRFYNVERELLHQSDDRAYSSPQIGPTAAKLHLWISGAPLLNTISEDVFRTDLTQSDDPLFGEGGDDTFDSDAESRLGSVTLSVDLSLIYQKQSDVIRRVFFFVTGVLAIAAIAAYRLARSVITPIRTLTTSVRALARNEYIQVPVEPIGGELEELAHGVNYLSSELETFHAKQREAIRLATVDLQTTLSLLEQKNTELYAARESAEAASAFKSQFVANMSHEIRTPLNAIIGTLSVMSKSGLDITQVDQIDIINKSSSTLLYLIEDILDISKIESGNLVVESINTDLESLLNDVAVTASMLAIDRGIELFVSPIPDTSLRSVYTDPLRLKQVLLNLLSNSIKFTHSGHVTLTTKLIDVEPALRTVQFCVEDTGIGIPEDKQEVLFSAFTQVDMSTTRRYGGTGLGLFICQGIVDLLDGTIALSSQENSGSRFDVVIPMRVSSSATVQNPVMQESVSGLTYHDSYTPLKSRIEVVIQSVFRGIHDSGLRKNESISVHNIPNKFLAASWIGALDSAAIAPNEIEQNPDSSANSLIQIALVSQMTPVIKDRLQAAGYTDYLVKTPSIIQLTRGLQQAINNQSFVTHRVANLPDNRPQKTTRQLTVLAVDDQRINIDLLMQYFDFLDIRGIYASSGVEGLEHLKAESVDLVLLDLHMPVHDGFYVVEKIRNGSGSNAQVPVIAMTADAYSSTRERAMAAGFDSVLTKPATVQQVSSVIDQWARADSANGLLNTAMIDVKACAEAVRGNEQWVKRALKTYGDEVPAHIQCIDEALRNQNRDQLFEVAHAVKGVSRLFQISPVADAAEELEASSASATWGVLRAQSSRLKEVLKIAALECKSIIA
ncbi:MAG: ATP-binding protein [Granulosicoccus sp.]